MFGKKRELEMRINENEKTIGKIISKLQNIEKWIESQNEVNKNLEGEIHGFDKGLREMFDIIQPIKTDVEKLTENATKKTTTKAKKNTNA